MRNLRLPRIGRTPKSLVSAPVIPLDKRAPYPHLTRDFEVLDLEVAPAFREFDEKALVEQRRYRRQQMIMLLGSALIAGLGGLQAFLADQPWPGFVLTVLGVTLAATGRISREQATQLSWLDARVKAERLRGLHFRYLSGTGPYSGADREVALRRAVLDVRRGLEPR